MKERIIKNLKHHSGWLIARPEAIFILVATTAGLVFCFLVPPLGGYDEFTHFPRVYHVASGSLWADKLDDKSYGGYLPGNVKEFIDDYRDLTRKGTHDEFKHRAQELRTKYSNTKADKHNLEPTPFTASSVYSPWSYLPSAVGIKLGMLLNLPLSWLVYLGRIFTLLAWLTLAYTALRTLPFGKWFLVVIALLPTSITLSATISPDALVNGTSWLLIALITGVFVRNRPFRKQTKIAIFALALFLCLSKPGYWMLAFLPVILPARYFTTKRKAWIWRISLVIVLSAASILYLNFTRLIAGKYLANQRPEVHLDSKEQIRFILKEPHNFLSLLTEQVISPEYFEVVSGVVGRLTNRLLLLPIWVIGLLYLSLFMAFVSFKRPPPLEEHKKYLLFVGLGVLIGTFLIINIALFVTFTQVRNPYVEGVQGRYFLPVIPLFMWLRGRKEKKFLPFSATHLPVFCLTISIIALISTYLTLA